jgi:hypothetical protein
MPRFCLWESMLALKGRFRTAFRRFSSSGVVHAQIEGKGFRCWYYSPNYITRYLVPRFELLSIEGLCSLVPPSYLETFAQRNPATFRLLVKAENRWKARWPWNRIGDYYIISLRKRG